MEANVQSGHMVTCAKSYKPETTLRHKDLGHRIILNNIYDGKVACADRTDLMIEDIIFLHTVIMKAIGWKSEVKRLLIKVTITGDETMNSRWLTFMGMKHVPWIRILHELWIMNETHE